MKDNVNVNVNVFFNSYIDEVTNFKNFLLEFDEKRISEFNDIYLKIYSIEVFKNKLHELIKREIVTNKEELRKKEFDLISKNNNDMFLFQRPKFIDYFRDSKQAINDLLSMEDKIWES